MEERQLIDLARRQHGLVRQDQALAAGITRRAIDRRLAAGRWERLAPGVYLVGGAPRTWHQTVLARCFAGGPDVLVSHRSAARLWGVVEADGRTELMVRGDRRVRVARARVHQSILLPDLDCTTRDAIPVTSLARTLVDVSSHQDPEAVGRWVDQAMRAEGLDLLDLRSCIARLAGPGRRHLQPIRTALSMRLPGYDPGDSDLEVRALRALHAAELPAPVQQHPVRRADGRIALLDLAYPPELVAIELDGWEHHGRRSAFDPDRIRRNELTLLGWTVLQFTATMSDEVLTATVRRALGRAHRRAS